MTSRSGSRWGRTVVRVPELLPSHDPVRFARPSEMEPLGKIAADLPQPPRLPPRFDPLGDHAHSVRVRQVHDRGDHGVTTRSFADGDYERRVDLHEVEVEVLQI